MKEEDRNIVLVGMYRKQVQTERKERASLISALVPVIICQPEKCPDLVVRLRMSWHPGHMLDINILLL